MECPGTLCLILAAIAVLAGFVFMIGAICFLAFCIDNRCCLQKGEKLRCSDVKRCCCLAREIKYSKELQQNRSKKRRPPIKNENIFHLYGCSIPDSLIRLKEILSNKTEEAKCQNTDLSLMIIIDSGKNNFDNAISKSTAVMDYLDEHQYMYSYADTSNSGPCNITIVIRCDWNDSVV